MDKAPKKPLEQLIAEHDAAKRIVGKRMRHIRTQADYQVLMTVHDTDTQRLMVVYCLSALSKLKFSREYEEFLKNFEEIKS